MIIFTPPVIIASTSLLLVRLVVALTFFFSALHKSRDFKKAAANEKMPIWLIAFVAVAEFAGALGLISGVLAQFAALGLMIIMCATLFLHIVIWKSPYWAQKGGWEYDLMLFILCSVVVVWGPGMLVLF